MKEKKHNFCAGPSTLPQEVFEQLSKAVINYNDTGLSILETSHRSDSFLEILHKTQDLVKDLLQISDDYSVLFLHGGASLEFLLVPYNLMKIGGTGAYLDTGRWSSKAIHEANILGNAKIVASSKDKNYNYIPTNYHVPTDADYFHCTTNNTIYGTQINEFPDIEIPLVADMSSDIFSRQMDFNKFDLIYAGAQKNVGTAGCALVVVKNSILGKTDRKIPTLLDYQKHIDNGSLSNTPTVFAIYTAYLNLTWLKNKGGIQGIEVENNRKASFLYEEIDRNPFFEGTARTEDRSKMNVTFNLKNTDKENLFQELCDDAGISGIVGHRSAGGYRASIYNAMPFESIEILVDTLRKFEKKLN
ncbi:3-phosphoserine/phosphohydroxythreonine transaminase [Aureivirga sp. CE67]|uniref:3-phosphoserine/phosphohydroxythreonine transaminase n=1 Tax=Aureivirga sp. CE67 TaxID=1788983 RepID=UPI0018CA2B0F|nr:3-phosphoserine/phosphohydroxythreonine transaminase [Aureivirga sp. CE67]